MNNLHAENLTERPGSKGTRSRNMKASVLTFNPTDDFSVNQNGIIAHQNNIMNNLNRSEANLQQPKYKNSNPYSIKS